MKAIAQLLIIKHRKKAKCTVAAPVHFYRVSALADNRAQKSWLRNDQLNGDPFFVRSVESDANALPTATSES